MSNIDINYCSVCSSQQPTEIIQEHTTTLIDGQKHSVFEIIQSVLNKNLRQIERYKICEFCLNSVKLIFKARERTAESTQDEIKNKIYQMFESFWSKHKSGHLLVTETNNQLIIEDRKLFYCRQCMKPLKSKELRKDHEESGCRINQEKIPKLAYNCLKTFFDESDEEVEDDGKTSFELQSSIPSSSGFTIKKEKDNTEMSPIITQSFQNQSIPGEVKEEELSICDVMIDEAEEMSFSSFGEQYGDSPENQAMMSEDSSYGRFVAQFKCPVCSGEFKSMMDLTQHANTSHSPIILCDTDFKQYENIDEDNSILYTCKECNYSSKIKANFKRHLLLMAMKKSRVSNFKHRQQEDNDIAIITKAQGNGKEQRLFQCKHCNYSSEFRANVMRHLKSRHSQNSELVRTPLVRMKCIDCDFETRHLNNMKQHRIAVHGPEPANPAMQSFDAKRDFSMY